MKYPAIILSYVFIALVAVFSIFPVSAAGVVGTGTAASCTEEALDAALLGGGLVTFNCGSGTHTIFLTGSKTIRENTLLDGGGHIILDGGGYTQIFYNSGVEFYIQNITLKNARSIQGSAIFNDMGILSVDGVTFNQNVAVRPGPSSDPSGGRGGAIFNAQGDMTITNSRFVGNRADNWGGAIFTTNGVVTISNSTFLLNNVSADYGSDGGAIANGSWGEPGSTINIVDSNLSLNVAPLTGGAIFSNTGVVTVENSFLGSNVANVGAAIGTRQDPTLTSQVNVLGSTLTNNIARYSGGGLYMLQHLSMTGSTLTANRARQYGGAIYLTEDVQADIIGNTFSANRAGRDGGAIFNDVLTFTIRNSTFTGNRADRGGGLFNSRYTPSNSTRLISNSTFSGNHANQGGAIFDETRSDGSAAHSGFYATKIEFSTFAYNAARADAGGAAIYGAATGVELRATIAAYSIGDACNRALSNIYNLIEYPSNSCGAGVIADPLLAPLADNGGTTQTHALLTGSPAIDAVVAPLLTGTGTADDPLGCTVEVDQRNFSRVSPRTTSTGVYISYCDVGAYESGAVEAVTTGFPLVQATPEATLPPVPSAVPVIVNCTPFRATSPRDGLPNGIANFYWDGAPGATSYLVTVSNEQGQQVATFNTTAPATTLSGDVSNGAIGAGFSFSWTVQALHNGRVYCTTPLLTIPRESPNNPPPATPVPQCGNGIQEVGETPNTCPNGY